MPGKVVSLRPVPVSRLASFSKGDPKIFIKVPLGCKDDTKHTAIGCQSKAPAAKCHKGLERARMKAHRNVACCGCGKYHDCFPERKIADERRHPRCKRRCQNRPQGLQRDKCGRGPVGAMG